MSGDSTTGRMTMRNGYKGKQVWEVRIGGETAYYLGDIDEVNKKAKKHPNYYHDVPGAPNHREGYWDAGYPISKMELIGTLDG